MNMNDILSSLFSQQGRGMGDAPFRAQRQGYSGGGGNMGGTGSFQPPSMAGFTGGGDLGGQMRPAVMPSFGEQGRPAPGGMNKRIDYGAGVLANRIAELQGKTKKDRNTQAMEAARQAMRANGRGVIQGGQVTQQVGEQMRMVKQKDMFANARAGRNGGQGGTSGFLGGRPAFSAQQPGVFQAQGRPFSGR